ncbi:MAG TPA: mechanosensitive ion channel [Novosphingobium sp.]|nr:mechanosensitive ion channel [Novosphingobium sp.]
MTALDPAALLGWSQALTTSLVHTAIAAGLALALHLILFAVLDRLVQLSPGLSDDIVVRRLRQPLRWSMVGIALAIARESDPGLAAFWAQVGRFIVPALMGWVAWALVKAFAAVLEERTGAADDEVATRSRRTRITVLSRSASFLIVTVTVALVLFGIPGVRNVGVTLLASAGMITLVLGVAAQPALKSLIGGIQIALTEPIRIGDFVVVDGESGRVEDIRLSLVVIRTGDERRLIVPTSKFLDATFQNWTRMGGGITGSVVLPISPGHPVAPIRAAYLALLEAQEDWDRRTGSLQVAEVRAGVVELKLVMSAKGPTSLNRLRSTVREAMLEWLRETMPEALVTEVR